MIELSTIATQPTPVMPGPAAPGGAAGGFVQLLSAFLDSIAGTTAPAQPAPAGDRQDLADDGKALPATADDDDGGDKDADPALMWLPVALPQPTPIVPPITLPTGLSTRAPADPAIAETGIFAGSPKPGAPRSGPIGNPPGTPIISGTDAVSNGAAPITLPLAGPMTVAPSVIADATTAADTDTSQPDSKTTARVQAPLPGPADGAPIATPTARPAAQAFAAAIAAAAGHAKPDQDQDRSDSRDGTAPIALAQTDVTTRPIVQATTGAQHAPLDLRDDRGLQGMIDRIEVLRDDADSRDTRIRLVPDALGGVDIAVRKDGDTMHVHFTAETQATRTLLTDAQPRLAELAEARGVKLGQTSVDAGTGGGTNHQPRPAAPRPIAPMPVATADTQLSTDQRLA